MDNQNKNKYAINVLEDIIISEAYEFDNSQDHANNLKDYFSSFNDPEDEVNSLEMSFASSSGPSLAVTQAEQFSDADAKSALIIESVESRPALWNIKDDDYKNKILRSRLWEEVTRDAKMEINPTNVLKVRKQWDGIKASYIRSKRRVASGSAGGLKKAYKFEKVLQFLDDTNEPRKSIEIGGADSQGESTSGDSGFRPKRKRFTPYQEESLALKRNYLDVFSQQSNESPVNVPVSVQSGVQIRDPVDNELDGLFEYLRPNLKLLPRLSRLKAQQAITLIVSNAVIENETQNN